MSGRLLMGCVQCKPRMSQKPLPNRRKSLLSRSREHLSPEAADRYMEFAQLLAKWSTAQYVSVVYQDVEHGLGGLTYNACSGPTSQRSVIHSHCMQIVHDEEVPAEIQIASDVVLADQTWNKITCPIPGTGKAEGMICMFSANKLSLTKTDLRLIGVVGELFNGEVNALHGDVTGNAIVIFDASVTGWRSVCTSYNWRKITGIQNGDELTSVFQVPEDNTIPVTGMVNGQKREFGLLWNFCLELQPARQIDGQQLWIGTVLSATDVSLELTTERQTSEALEQDEAIRFSDIKMECLLGKGGFGSVHRAIWQGTPVAIKILEDCGRPMAEVIQEAKIGQRLRHLNLVETIASGVDYRDNGEKFTWIMMELCNKGTLWQTIECGYFHDSPDCIDMKKYLRTANHIVDGIKYMHESNVLHGDLNCNNILMSDEITAKISDLGLSRVFAGHTLATDTYGTISHQPPELLSTGQLSFSSDIYSFGVILYEMFVGERAYHGLRVATIMSQKLEGHVLELPPAANKSLRALINACLAQEHRSRPTLPEIQEWLTRCADR